MLHTTTPARLFHFFNDLLKLHEFPMFTNALHEHLVLEILKMLMCLLVENFQIEKTFKSTLMLILKEDLLYG